MQSFILVSAPAGFGKTSLVADWLATVQAPAAWLSLDEADNALPVFMAYLTAAIETIEPEACVHTRGMLRGVQRVPADALAFSLINDVVRIPQDFVLVLDDAHLITDEAVRDLLARLIRNQPQTMHLVVISRTDLSLPLTSLRAGRMTEIRASDLRFTLDETQAFLTNATGVSPADGLAAKLDERIEGWAVGLRLALLTLRDRRNPAAVVEEIKGASAERHIMAYLLGEVLERLTPATVRQLLHTSILTRFCAGLCEALSDAAGDVPSDALGDGDTAMSGSDFINWLDQTGLFLTPLDHEWRWFRFHHLFQQLLQYRLSEVMPPEHIARLHSRAGAWLSDQGLVDEALQHYLAAGEPHMAAGVVERYAHDALNAESFRTLQTWLNMLPPDVIASRASLLVMKALLEHLQGDYVAMQLTIHQAVARADLERRLQPRSATAEQTALRQRIAGEIASLQLIESLARTTTVDPSQSTAFGAQALRDLPPACVYLRSLITIYRGLAQQRLGQFNEAERQMQELIQQHGNRVDTYSTRIGWALGIMYHNALRFVQLGPHLQRVLALAQQAGLLTGICWSRYFLAAVSYEWNELDDAIEHLSFIRDHRYGLMMVIARRALVALAVAQQARGLPDDARQTHDMLAEDQMRMSGCLDDETQALGARLALLNGQPDRASVWAHGVQLAPPQGLGGDERALLTRTQVLLADGTPQSAQQALDELERFCRTTRDEHCWTLHVRALAQKALALDALGQRKAARETLQDALTLARPAGLLRTFVDLGPRMQDLLRRLAKGNQRDAYLARILAAFAAPHGNNMRQRHEKATPAASATDPVQVNMLAADLLTQREAEVLCLLARHQSNKQIAQALVVTPETVQRHASNIFTKLAVHNRRQAVAKAKALGILTP